MASGSEVRFKNSLLIDYEKSTPLIDGPNQRGFDESFITPNCPNTDPLYVYIENGMVGVPASQRHKRDNLPNPGGKWRWDNDEGWMSPGYDFMNADLLVLREDERRSSPTTARRHRTNLSSRCSPRRLLTLRSCRRRSLTVRRKRGREATLSGSWMFLSAECWIW